MSASTQPPEGAEDQKSRRGLSLDTANEGLHRSIVGASLLAMAVDQSMQMLNDRPQSRAGSLPQFEFACLI